VQDYLLDTNIIPYYSELKGGCKSLECYNLQSNLNKLIGEHRLFLSVVSQGEIEYGLNTAPVKDIIQQDQVRKTIDGFPLLNIDSNVASNYGDLRGRLFRYCAPRVRRGRSKRSKRIEEWFDPTTSKELQIQENDLWLCAVAMTYNLIFVTHDSMDPLKQVTKGDLLFEDWLV